MFEPILWQVRMLGCGGHTVACMSRIALVLLLAVAVSVLVPDAGVARRRWRPPLPDGTLSAAFTFDRAGPYVRGARRGIDLRGAPGARVVAACAGTVMYAGRIPGWGRGVSLRCGGLVATELGLASASVARGARVWPGAVVGRLAQHGMLRLGARRVGSRHGYVDPLGLLSRGEPSAPPPIAPRGGPAARPRSRITPPAALVANPRATPAVAPAASAHPTAVAAPHATALPTLAWAGLALLAAGVGGGGVTWRRRRGYRRAGPALAQR
jgi:hypothetical protein